MAIFGKRRPTAGLGAGVVDAQGTVASSSGADPAGMIVDGATMAPPVGAQPSAAKPSRAERKAMAKAEKAARASAGPETGAPAGPLGRKLTRAERKAEVAAERGAAQDVRLSSKIIIEFYPGMTKEDAAETARNWALTHMDLPSMCFYYLHKIQDGYAIEVQEGVGKAYLPSVLELAKASPGRLVVVPMVRRKMTIFYSARTEEYDAQVLSEYQDPPAMPENPSIQATRGPNMQPVIKQHVELLIAGGVASAIGGLALLSSIAFYALDPKTKVPPEWRTTEVSQLPIMQWNRLQASSKDSYVVRLEFQDGQWRIVRQAAGASVDVASTPSADASSDQIVGGAPPAGSPGALPPAGPVPPAGASPAGGQPAVQSTGGVARPVLPGSSQPGQVRPSAQPSPGRPGGVNIPPPGRLDPNG